VLLVQEIHIATETSEMSPSSIKRESEEPADLDLCFKLCF
jgi:hypothetical protein